MKKTISQEQFVKIETQEQFVQEYNTLMEKIDQNITDLSQFQKVSVEKPSVALTEKLNRLKLHRTKLRNFLLAYGEASDSAWNTVKDEAQSIFKAAQEEYLQPFVQYSKA